MHLSPLLAPWLLAWFVLATTAVSAQQARGGPPHRPACNSHDKLVELLQRNYTEAPSAMGLQANGHLLEVFMSKESGSWTIVSTRPDGVSCIIAAGQYWRELPDSPIEPAV
jgi:hypothetical protein